MKYLLLVALLAGTAWGGDNVTCHVSIELPPGMCERMIRNTKALGCQTDPDLIAAADGVLPYLQTYTIPANMALHGDSPHLRKMQEHNAAIKRLREALEKAN